MIALPKPGKDLMYLQYLYLISLLSMIGKPFERIILKVFQSLNEERSILNASHFRFHADNSMMLSTLIMVVGFECS
jgi:hypothetical protein